jgi:hypothetical protein
MDLLTKYSNDFRPGSLQWPVLKAVLRIRIWSDLDLLVGSGSDVWDQIRIRILALINDPISTFLVYVKAINTSEISVVQLFDP